MNLHSRSRHVRCPPKIWTVQQQSALVSVVILLFGPSFSPSFISPSVCSAAPALWSPITDAIENLLHPHGATKEEVNIPPLPSPAKGTSGIVTPSSAQVIVTAEDYGVVQLDLEGDPNCDYTTKVRIAGSEYNVIIDTGSAHFAVASSACRECVIQRKDSFRPNEEEIPIDRDPLSTPKTDQGSLKLLRAPSVIPFAASSVQPIPHPIPSPVINTTSSTTIASPNIAHPDPPKMDGLYPPVAISSASLSTTSTITAATTGSPHAVLPVPQLPHSVNIGSLVPGTVPSPTFLPLRDISSQNKNGGNDADFLARESALKAMAASLKNNQAGSQLRSSVPKLDKTTAAAAAAAAARVGATQAIQTPQVRRRSSSKILAVAPAENLYPLSSTSQDHGQTIQVSYGIKSHSVGWSGVMTSDLITLEMAKVTTPNKDSKDHINLSSSVVNPGVTMEKETNVEFAAITENTGFFSQECGAQHGIWGLGYRSLSVDRKPTLLDTLSATMKIPNGFALQLCGRTANTTKSGNMFLGGYSKAHLAEPMQYVPLVKKDWYQIRLDGFKVMGEKVEGMQNLNLPKTIIDSGTTNILMSHYNLQFLIQALARSPIVQWSSLIPQQDINNFWFKNAVLRLPRSSFQIATAARAVEVVMSGISIPIYTSSFLRIKAVPAGQAPPGYVDFWWHGFASSTSPDAIEAESASGGAVMPGSVGTILGETLFAGKVVYFERGNDDAQPGDADFGRIGFGRGQNCFGPSDHASVDVLASEGRLAKAVEKVGPVRVVATSDANTLGLAGSGVSSGSGHESGDSSAQSPKATAASVTTGVNSSEVHQIHFGGFDGPIRLMGGARPLAVSPLGGSGNAGLWWRLVPGLLVAIVGGML